MKVNFNSGNSKTNKHKVVTGSFEDMIKMREDKLPELQEAIQELFDNYDGGMLAIVKIKEDENGDSEGHTVFVGGVARISTQIELSKALFKTSKHIRDALLDKIKSNPKALLQLLTTMGQDLKEEE